MEADENTHWRDSARTPRFFFMDAYAVFPLFVFFLHMTFMTLGIALTTTAFFILLERYKFTIPVFKRFMRSTLAGPLRIAQPWWRK